MSTYGEWTKDDDEMEDQIMGDPAYLRSVLNETSITEEFAASLIALDKKYASSQPITEEEVAICNKLNEIVKRYVYEHTYVGGI